jgi:hypothetical protein
MVELPNHRIRYKLRTETPPTDLLHSLNHLIENTTLIRTNP